MKTSNKILIAAFIFLILLGIAAAAIMKVNVFGDVIEGDGELMQQDRTSNSFNKVDVAGNFHVYFTQDSTPEVILTTDNNLMEYIITEVIDNELRIYSKDRLRPTELKLDISSMDIMQIKASASARVEGQNRINSPSLNLIGSAGSFIELDAIVDKLIVKLSAGSHAKLSGQARDAEYSGSAGSEIEAYEMEAQTVTTNASAGSNLKVNAQEELSVNASAGSDVYYEGTPFINELNISAGAAVHQRR